jgi:hypothetical protein
MLGTVIRLSAILVGAALLLSGCSTEEGARAQELLQQAERAQAQLRSATFEVSLGFVMDGQQVDLALQGAASKQGAAFSLRATGLPGAAGRDVRFVVRGKRAWTSDGGGRWQAMPVPPDVGAASGSMGAQAFQELARHVQDVRVTEHRQVAGKPVTTIAGEIDTAGMLETFSKLGSLSGAGGDNAGFAFELDDLGLELGDIEAVLSIDERTHLLDAALVTLAIEAQGKKLELELRYRVTSWNQPVELPAVSG